MIIAAILFRINYKMTMTYEIYVESLILDNEIIGLNKIVCCLASIISLAFDS